MLDVFKCEKKQEKVKINWKYEHMYVPTTKYYIYLESLTLSKIWLTHELIVT